MSATFAMKNVKVRAFGTFVNVPNNAIAKLMYYLDCVATVIDYHDRTLTDYQNYNELSGEELVAVYQLAKLLNPSLFINSGIFIVDQNLLSVSNNQFYEVTDETVGFHVNREIIIGGKTVKVLKIMACNDKWLSANYFNPINEIDRLIIDLEKRRYYSQTITTETTIREKPVIIAPTPEFRSYPFSMTCPFCLNGITTKTESKLNCFACICFILFPFFYCCVKICSNRNVCCCDIIHICPRCGKILGYYNSC
jgi:hypothetical protein